MNRSQLDNFRSTTGLGQGSVRNANARSNDAMPQSPYQNYNQGGGMQAGGRPVRQGAGSNRYIPPTYNFGRNMYGGQNFDQMDWNNVQNYDLPQQGNNPYQQQYMQGLRGTTGRFPQGGRGPMMPQFRGQGGGGLPQGYSYDPPDNGMNYTAVMPSRGGRYAYGPDGDRIEVGGQGGGYMNQNDFFDPLGLNAQRGGDFMADPYGFVGGPQMPQFRNGGYNGPNGGGGNMQQFMQMMQQYMQGQGNGPNAGGGNGWQGGANNDTERFPTRDNRVRDPSQTAKDPSSQQFGSDYFQNWQDMMARFGGGGNGPNAGGGNAPPINPTRDNTMPVRDGGPKPPWQAGGNGGGGGF